MRSVAYDEPMQRIWILPIAAVMIAGVCWYKLAQTHEPPTGRVIEQVCPAKSFQFSLRGQTEPFHYTNLRAFLGRHHVVIVFFDGAKGAEADPVLLRLRNEFERLNRRGVKVLGISTNLPQHNRPPKPGRARLPNQPAAPFPFPLLTDFPSTKIVHHRWGRVDENTGETKPGVFHIDAAGNIRCDGRKPLPVDDPDQVIDTLLGD